MTDPIEVIARAICRCSCSLTVCGPGDPCWDWGAMVPEARAVLAALEEDGYEVRMRPNTQPTLKEAQEARDRALTEISRLVHSLAIAAHKAGEKS